MTQTRADRTNYMRGWRARNRERNRELNRETYKRNTEIRLANTRRWKAANPERVREINKLSDDRNRERRRAYARKHHAKNREAIAARRTAAQRALKRAVLEAYGGQCFCCGEANVAFLTLDHVNNDGARHRQELKHVTRSLYRWARDNGYPPTLQPACWNCNMGRYHNGGICPHSIKHSS